MEDELQLDLEEGQNINKTQERIKSLATKVAEEARAKEEAQKKAEEADTARLAAERERDFYAKFTDVLPKYAAASEFKDAILEKVKAGYEMEDAAVSVLNANGKLIPQAAEPEMTIEHAPIGGGSAATVLPLTADKPTSEMNQEDLRAELMKPERQAELERVLRQGF